jgi:hypothetical protein
MVKEAKRRNGERANGRMGVAVGQRIGVSAYGRVGYSLGRSTNGIRLRQAYGATGLYRTYGTYMTIPMALHLSRHASRLWPAWFDLSSVICHLS